MIKLLVALQLITSLSAFAKVKDQSKFEDTLNLEVTLDDTVQAGIYSSYSKVSGPCFKKVIRNDVALDQTKTSEAQALRVQKYIVKSPFKCVYELDEAYLLMTIGDPHGMGISGMWETRVPIMFSSELTDKEMIFNYHIGKNGWHPAYPFQSNKEEKDWIVAGQDGDTLKVNLVANPESKVAYLEYLEVLSRPRVLSESEIKARKARHYESLKLERDALVDGMPLASELAGYILNHCKIRKRKAIPAFVGSLCFYNTLFQVVGNAGYLNSYKNVDRMTLMFMASYNPGYETFTFKEFVEGKKLKKKFEVNLIPYIESAKIIVDEFKQMTKEKYCSTALGEENYQTNKQKRLIVYDCLTHFLQSMVDGEFPETSNLLIGINEKIMQYEAEIKEQ